MEALLATPPRYDLALTLSDLRFGIHDPTMQIRGGAVAKAAHTQEGPVEVHLREEPGGVRARLFGPGARYTLARLPGLLGLEDEPRPVPDGPVRQAMARLPGLRLPRVPWLSEILYAVIMQQRVQWTEAARSHHRLVHRWSGPAPGPAGLSLPVHPETLAKIAPAHWFEAGVDHRRSAAVREAMASHRRLDALTLEDARPKLRSLRGVGPWTVETTLGMGLGDPDAVPVGDYSLPNSIAWALAGEPRADDARMLDLLEPYRGQRYRAIRLLLGTFGHAPRRGPRLERPGPPRSKGPSRTVR